MRLIDANALIVSKDWANCNCPAQVIHKAPTIEAEPVRHGEWRFCGSDRWNDAYVCSECGKIAMNDSSYCPNCGAKMDGKEKE